jgi:hypothetical protein
MRAKSHTSSFLLNAFIPDLAVDAPLVLAGAAAGSSLAFFPPHHECTRVLTERSVFMQHVHGVDVWVRGQNECPSAGDPADRQRGSNAFEYPMQELSYAPIFGVGGTTKPTATVASSSSAIKRTKTERRAMVISFVGLVVDGGCVR